MSLRPGIRIACRNLAIRSRPALPRQGVPAWSVSKRRYADDSAQKPPIPPQAPAAPITPAQPQAASSEAVGNAAAEQKARQAIEDVVAESSNDDVMDQLEAVLRNMPEEENPNFDALAEEAAADKSEITVEEALSQLERAAKPDKASSELEGGLTPGQEEYLYQNGSIPPVVSNGDAQADLEVLARGGILTDMVQADQHLERELEREQEASLRESGLKFKAPQLPLPPNSKVRDRYHPVLDQLTNLLMRHGKKGVAQRNMAMILNHLRTSPAPILSKKNRLLAGHPPASHFPLNPLMYLTMAIDSVAPLVRITYIKGAAGGGRALEMPGPLAVRQRRRTAFMWILDVVNKKRSSGSGRTQLAQRIASEIIAVAEGRSSVWEKRLAVHKLATATRANLTAKLVNTRGNNK